MPGAAPAILVSISLAMLGIISFMLLTYFAHCFLIVVIDSAAGINEIRWPSEWVADWLTKAVYLVWIILPLFFVAFVVLMATGDPTAGGLTLLILLWLVSPVMFLSSLAAKSWAAIFYGPFLVRWGRFFFAYLVFLVLSAIPTALGVGLIVWSMRSFAGVGLAAIFLPAMFLIYFRLLGRYAWYVTTRRMKKAKKKKAVNPLKGAPVEALDPWAPPDLERTELLDAQDAIQREAIQSLDEDDTSLDSMEVPQVRQKRAPAKPAVKFAPPAKLDEAFMPVEKLAPGEELVPMDDETVADAPIEVLDDDDDDDDVEPEDEWTRKKKPYGVMTDIAARQSYAERKGTPGDGEDGYSVESSDDLSIGAPISLWNYYVEREKKEQELRDQGKAVRQFERPRKPPTLGAAMTQEIIGFLFFPHSLRCWISLGILLGIELAVFSFVVQLSNVIAAM